MSKDYSREIFHCHHCGVQCRMGQYWVTDDDYVLCDNCFDDCVARCEECGTIIYDPPEERSQDVYYSRDNRLLCRKCYIKERKRMMTAYS